MASLHFFAPRPYKRVPNATFVIFDRSERDGDGVFTAAAGHPDAFFFKNLVRFDLFFASYIGREILMDEPEKHRRKQYFCKINVGS